MNEAHIHNAMGEISEELIDPVAKLRQKKRYPALKWAAMAACLCLLLSLPLGWNGAEAENAGSSMQMDAPQENFFSDTVTDGIHAAVFRAKVLEVHEKYVLAEPLEGENELRCSDKIEVSFWKLEQVPEIAVGDILEVVYDGMIQETYPARITGTFSIRILE